MQRTYAITNADCPTTPKDASMWYVNHFPQWIMLMTLECPVIEVCVSLKYNIHTHHMRIVLNVSDRFYCQDTDALDRYLERFGQLVGNTNNVNDLMLQPQDAQRLFMSL